jgi:hypothetical protein
VISQLAQRMSEVDLSKLGAQSPTQHVYVLILGERIIYIGRTADLNHRLTFHRFGSDRLRGKEFDRVLALELPRDDAAALEGALIRRFNPQLCGNAPTDETRDVEMLAMFSLKYDQAAALEFKARKRRRFTDSKSRRQIRLLAARTTRRVNLQSVLWECAKGYLAKLEDA